MVHGDVSDPYPSPLFASTGTAAHILFFPTTVPVFTLGTYGARGDECVTDTKCLASRGEAGDNLSCGKWGEEEGCRRPLPHSAKLSTILKSKENNVSAVQSGASTQRKRLQTATFDGVDKAVFAWFMDMRARNVPLSSAVIQQKAEDFACILGCADFKASMGWLQQFKNRHSITAEVTAREAAPADTSRAMP